MGWWGNGNMGWWGSGLVGIWVGGDTGIWDGGDMGGMGWWGYGGGIGAWGGGDMGWWGYEVMVLGWTGREGRLLVPPGGCGLVVRSFLLPRSPDKLRIPIPNKGITNEDTNYQRPRRRTTHPRV